MDQELLRKNGVNPSDPKLAILHDYVLKIGSRASLLPSHKDRAYGILMEVDNDEITKLYSEKSVSDYIPENVLAITESDEKVQAMCYNLPVEMLSGTNESYAKSLHQLATKLKFPNDYLEDIKKFIN